MSDNRRRVSRGSFGARLRAAASVFLTGAVPPRGRVGPLVPASEWNGRFGSLDDVQIDEATALNVSAVWACASLISDTLGQLPAGVFKREGDRRLALPDHPINKLLSGSVNDYQGRKALFKTVELQRQIRGNGYMQVERETSGTPVGLWPLSNATPTRRADGTLVYVVGSGGQRQELPPSDVIHVRGLSLTTCGLVGESPVAAARNALTLNIHAEKFGRDFFKNEARSGGFLLHPGKLNDQAKSNIRNSVQNQNKRPATDAKDGAASREHHAITVLEEGMKWIATTIAPEEAQFLSTRQFQLEEIARWYRVPLVLIQSTEKTTSWGTGVEQLLIAFSQFTISPLAQAFEEELSLKLLTQEERDDGLYVRLDLRGMLRGDSASRAAYYASGIQNRWLLPNEVRAREELDPLPDGDTFEAPARPVIE